MLMGRVAIRLKRSDKSAHPRREDDQITGTCSGGVGVSDSRGHKYGRPWANDFGSVDITESKLSFQDVPRFVIGMVDMQDCRTTATPFMDAK